MNKRQYIEMLYCLGVVRLYLTDSAMRDPVIAGKIGELEEILAGCIDSSKFDKEEKK